MNKKLITGLLAAAFAAFSTVPAAAQKADMADGEVQKVDVDARKVTIRHGELKNLDMPPMKMVFQVRDPALLGPVKAGDKVRFKVEKTDAAFVVTEIQVVK
jgi:Cu(I)/Ag(I) efflux system periplasmic protein CusF